jgi:hypothetical protein
MSSADDRPHLFYNNKKCCQELWLKIKNFGHENNYICHDVTDEKIFAQLPKSFTTVPILVVKGISVPLVGKEVFNWVETQQYINLNANNITKLSNPDFYVDPTIGKQADGNFSAIKDCDDKKIAVNSAYIEDIDKIQYTPSMSKRYIDRKISTAAQQQKMQELLASRNNDLINIMNANKEF